MCVCCSDSSRLDGSGSYDVAPHSQEVLVFLLFSGELLWRGDAQGLQPREVREMEKKNTSSETEGR